MSSNLRRGLLGSLFAGGLLALGCTAANAADTTPGSDLSGSAFISAAASAESASTGLLGDPSLSESTAATAVVDVAVAGDTATVTDVDTTADVAGLSTPPIRLPRSLKSATFLSFTDFSWGTGSAAAATASGP